MQVEKMLDTEMVKRVMPYVIILVVGTLFISYGLQADLWYPDDGLLALWSKGIIENNGMPGYSIIEQQSDDCVGKFYYKPLLSIYLMSGLMFIGGDVLFKLFTPITIILIMFSIYYISKKFIDKWLALPISLLFVGIPIILQWSLSNNTDIFTALVFLWFFYYFYNSAENPSRRNIILTGIMTGLLIHTKEIMYIVPIAIIGSYWLVSRFVLKENNKLLLKHLLIILAIGFAIASPFFIRNYVMYHNPIYPFMPNVFGYDYLDVEGYYEVFRLQLVPFANIFGIQPIWNNLFYMLPITLFTIAIAILIKKKGVKETVYLSIILGSVITFFTSPSNDTRYLIFLFPVILFFFGYYLNMFGKAYKKYITIFVYTLAIISVTFAFMVFPHILVTYATIPAQEKEVFAFLRDTPEDSVIFDVFTSSTSYHTNRKTFFAYQFCGYELWNYWKLPVNEMYSRFEKHGIDYIIFHLSFMKQTEEDTTQWGVMPVMAINSIPAEFIKNMTMFGNWAIVMELKTREEIEQEQTGFSSPVVLGQVIDNVRMNRPADILLRENYAYVSTFGGVSVVDISDENNPVIVGFQNDMDNVSDMVVADMVYPYLYTVSFDKGTFITVDISDPTNPQTMAAPPFFKQPVGAHMYNSSVVAVTDFGLNSVAFVDVSDPLMPTIISGITSDEYMYQPQNFAIRDGFLYVALGGGNALTVIDATNLNDLKIVGYVRDDNALKVSDWVCLMDDYAYVLAWGKGDVDQRHHLTVVDISDVTKLNVVSTLPLDELPSGINCMGQYILFCGMDVKDYDPDYADYGGRGYLEVVDVSVPAIPKLVYKWYHPQLANNYFNIIRDEYMYVTQRANNTDGFVVLELPKEAVETWS